MDKIKQLYFVALIPPSPIFEEVNELKREVFDRFGSKAALRSPPHITLHMPFQYREDREEKLYDVLEDQSKGQKPFGMEHDGFGCFEPRVIFVNVATKEAFREFKKGIEKSMRRHLNLENADYKGLPFHPHMTIAFRDLKKAVFSDAWPTFEDRKFSYSWDCQSVFLLKHTGKEWKVHREFPFESKTL